MAFTFEELQQEAQQAQTFTFEELQQEAAPSQPDPPRSSTWEELEAEKIALQNQRITWLTGFASELKERTSELARGAASTVAGSSRALAAFADFMDRNVADLTPGDPKLEERTLFKLGQKIDELAGKLPDAEKRDFYHDLTRAGGQMAGMLAGGAGARALKLSAAAMGTTMGMGAEFDDAWQRSVNRGDDPDTAFAKALGYATVAGVLENRLGAGRVLRQMFPSAKDAVKELTNLGVSKRIIGNFVAGGLEEGSQRFAQNWIVEGEPSLEGAGREALIGSLVQGTISLPTAAMPNRSENASEGDSGAAQATTEPAKARTPIPQSPIAPGEQPQQQSQPRKQGQSSLNIDYQYVPQTEQERGEYGDRVAAIEDITEAANAANSILDDPYRKVAQVKVLERALALAGESGGADIAAIEVADRLATNLEQQKSAAGQSLQAEHQVNQILDPLLGIGALMRVLREKQPGVNPLSTSAGKKMLQLQKELEALPEGILKARKMHEMAELVASEAKNNGIRPTDLARDWWYASVLSRVGTMTNVVGGSFLTSLSFTMLATMDTAIRRGHPVYAARMMLGFLQSFADSAVIAGRIVRTGDKTLLPDHDRRVRAALSKKQPYNSSLEEWSKSHNIFKKMVGQLKWTHNLIVALDYINSYPARDVQLAYSSVLKKDKPKMEAAIRQWDKQAVKKAGEQARQEVGGDAPKSVWLLRRKEILLDAFEKQELANALHVARRVAQNADPIGFSGAIYRHIAKWPWWVRAVAQLGFLRAAINMTVNATDYMPGVGLVNLWRAKHGDLKGKMSEEQQSMLKMAQMSAIGTTLGLAAAYVFKDDDEDGLHITGGFNGLTHQQKRQLYQQGWRPYSFNWLKDGRVTRHVTFKQAPFAPPLAIVGSMADQRRWRRETWDEQNWPGRITSSYLSGLLYIRDISTLTGLTQVLGASAYSIDKPEEQMSMINKKLGQTVTRTAAGFTPSIFKEIDSFMDNQSYRPTKDGDALGWHMQHLPVFRRFVGEGPDLNYIGEPVRYERAPWRAWTGGNPNKDEIWSDIGALLEKEIWMPKFSGSTAKVFDSAGEPRDMTNREAYRYAKHGHQIMAFYIRENRTDLNLMSKEEATEFMLRISGRARRIAKAMIQEESDTGKQQSVDKWMR